MPPSSASTRSPEAAGLYGRDCDADSSDYSLRQTGVASDLFPGVAAVGRFVEPAVGAAALKRPGLANDLPDAGIEHAGVCGVDRDVDCPGDIALVEDLLPGLAAILCAKDAALFIRAGHVAESCDIGDVRILRVDAQGADLLRVCQADMRPGVTGVGRFVDTVAVGGVPADIPFAHAGVNDVWIGVGYGDCSD